MTVDDTCEVHWRRVAVARDRAGDKAGAAGARAIADEGERLRREFGDGWADPSTPVRAVHDRRIKANEGKGRRVKGAGGMGGSLNKLGTETMGMIG